MADIQHRKSYDYNRVQQWQHEWQLERDYHSISKRHRLDGWHTVLGTLDITMSNTSSLSLWGRAWQLLIIAANGDEYTLSSSSWDPEALRITFDILESVLPSPYWYADISVYNLNDATAQNIL